MTLRVLRALRGKKIHVQRAHCEYQKMNNLKRRHGHLQYRDPKA